MSVDTVITDPPWGEYEKINASQIYGDFILEAARILRPNGSLVFLTSLQDEAQQALKKHGFTYSFTPLKISGKDTFMFCAEKLKFSCLSPIISHALQTR
jgi:23S rRNA G2445 N2-methylase RlmL